MNRFQRSLAILPFAVVLSSAQGVDWSATRLSVTAQWLIAQKEFGQYWKNGPGLGAISNVPLDKSFSFVGFGSLSWHSPSRTARQAKIPQVLLFKLGLGLEAQIPFVVLVEPSLGVALVNNTFIFTGPAAPNDIDNAIESEFGAGLFLRLNVHGFPRFGLIVAAEPIFTGPAPVATFSLGAAVALF